MTRYGFSIILSALLIVPSLILLSLIYCPCQAAGPQLPKSITDMSWADRRLFYIGKEIVKNVSDIKERLGNHWYADYTRMSAQDKQAARQFYQRIHDGMFKVMFAEIKGRDNSTTEEYVRNYQENLEDENRDNPIDYGINPDDLGEHGKWPAIETHGLIMRSHAWSLVGAGEFARAAKSFGQALSELKTFRQGGSGDQEECELAAKECLMATGDWQEVLKSSAWTSQLEQAECLYNLERLSEAGDLLLNCVSIPDGTPTAEQVRIASLLHRCGLALKERNQQLAKTFLEAAGSALKTVPPLADPPSGWQNDNVLGQSLLLKQKYRQAQEHFEKALQQITEDAISSKVAYLARPVILVHVGDAAMKQGLESKAEQCFKDAEHEAEQHGGNRALPACALADLYKQCKRPQDQIKTLTDACPHERGDDRANIWCSHFEFVEIHRKLAEALKDNGQSQEAAVVQAKADKHAKDFADILRY
jgi:tetratricopeptide (TPR) repeat protein